MDRPGHVTNCTAPMFPASHATCDRCGTRVNVRCGSDFKWYPEEEISFIEKCPGKLSVIIKDHYTQNCTVTYVYISVIYIYIYQCCI